MICTEQTLLDVWDGLQRLGEVESDQVFRHRAAERGVKQRKEAA